MAHKNQLPLHVAIIPDGNRRWAKEKKLEAVAGHQRSGDKVISILEEAKNLGIKYITLWGFSTENWQRDKKEIDFLFKLLEKGVQDIIKYSKKNNVRFRHIGRKDRLPRNLVRELEKAEKETRNFSELYVQACLDYGGRDEIVRAVNNIIRNGVKEVDEKRILEFLDFADIPDPDLIIRTSGEYRTSGFMPFQSSYSELYFTKTKFPDFSAKDLKKAIKEFSKRKRNFGN